MVGAYITAAYWFTSSTSFANPAVTLARAFSNTPAGIRPTDAGGFILSQLLGTAAAVPLFHWLTAPSARERSAPIPEKPVGFLAVENLTTRFTPIFTSAKNVPVSFVPPAKIEPEEENKKVRDLARDFSLKSFIWNILRTQ